MPPRRILYVITELDPGGAEKALFHLVTRLDRERFEPEVASLMGDGAVGEWLERERVAVHALHASAWSLPLAAAKVWRLMRRGRFDIVHTFLFHANVLGRICARLARVPRVVSSVRVEEPRGSHRILNWLTWRLADRFVCVSESTKRFFCERCRAPAKRVAVIPNGVDTAVFAPRHEPPPSIEEPVHMASVGRLDPQKGYDVLIDAARLCAERDLVFRITIAGDGPARAKLERQVENAGLRDATTLMGRCEDVPGLLRSADLFVSASRWEGMPNAVLEAMAAGLPVVATAVGGTPEVVAAGETGLLAPPENPQALADALTELILDREKRQRWGQAGRARVEQRFTWEQNAATHVELYESLCAADQRS